MLTSCSELRPEYVQTNLQLTTYKNTLTCRVRLNHTFPVRFFFVYDYLKINRKSLEYVLFVQPNFYFILCSSKFHQEKKYLYTSPINICVYHMFIKFLLNTMGIWISL